MMRFADFVEINPQTPLRKNIDYPFVDMASIQPTIRYVRSKIKKKFKSGGAKFKSNDILFARITPCLENGKIAQIVQLDGDLGFGSTEFFVFREKQNVSTSAYIYYLVKSKRIRDVAEKSMTGTSGRQRVDINSIKNIQIYAPDIKTQNKITRILSNYDNLIQNNIFRVKILEEICKNLYNHWFINFSFPSSKKIKFVDFDKKKIPSNWKVSSIEEVSEIIFKGSSIVYSENSQVPVLNQKCIRDGKIILNNIRFANELKSKNINLYLKKKDILINSMGVGTLGRVSRNLSISKKMIIHNCITVIRANSKKIKSEYLYYVVKEFEEYFVKVSKGTTGQTTLDLKFVKKLPILVPERNIYEKFVQIVTPIWEQMGILENKCEILKKKRDLLMPNLIDGNINLSKLEIK